MAYYSLIRQLKFLTPASIHRSAVCLMVDRSWLQVEEALRKQRAFCSFQISHAAKAKRVSAPFCLSPCHRLRHWSHQASRDVLPTCDASAPRTANIVHQTWREYEHEATM